MWRSSMKILICVLFHQTSWYPACTCRLWCPSSSWTLLCTISVGNCSAVGNSEIVTHHFSPLMLCSHPSLLCWASMCINHHVCLLDDFQTHFTIFQHAVLHYVITMHLHQFVVNISVRSIFHQFKPDHITNSLVEHILQCYCFCTLMYHMSSILHHVSYVPLATGAWQTQKLQVREPDVLNKVHILAVPYQVFSDMLTIVSRWNKLHFKAIKCEVLEH